MPSGVPQQSPLDQKQMLHGMVEHLGAAAVLSGLFHAGNNTSHHK